MDRARLFRWYFIREFCSTKNLIIRCKNHSRKGQVKKCAYRKSDSIFRYFIRNIPLRKRHAKKLAKENIHIHNLWILATNKQNLKKRSFYFDLNLPLLWFSVVEIKTYKFGQNKISFFGLKVTEQHLSICF